MVLPERIGYICYNHATQAYFDTLMSDLCRIAKKYSQLMYFPGRFMLNIWSLWWSEYYKGLSPQYYLTKISLYVVCFVNVQ
jgi:hypothetical protein